MLGLWRLFRQAMRHRHLRLLRQNIRLYECIDEGEGLQKLGEFIRRKGGSTPIKLGSDEINTGQWHEPANEGVYNSYLYGGDGNWWMNDMRNLQHDFSIRNWSSPRKRCGPNRENKYLVKINYRSMSKLISIWTWRWEIPILWNCRDGKGSW